MDSVQATEQNNGAPWLKKRHRTGEQPWVQMGVAVRREIEASDGQPWVVNDSYREEYVDEAMAALDTDRLRVLVGILFRAEAEGMADMGKAAGLNRIDDKFGLDEPTSMGLARKLLPAHEIPDFSNDPERSMRLYFSPRDVGNLVLLTDRVDDVASYRDAILKAGHPDLVDKYRADQAESLMLQCEPPLTSAGHPDPSP